MKRGTNVAPIPQNPIPIWPLFPKIYTNVAPVSKSPIPMWSLSPKTLYQCGPYPQKNLYHFGLCHNTHCTNVNPILKKSCTTVAHITRNIVPIKLCINVAPIPKNTLPIWPLSTKTLYQCGSYPKNPISRCPYPQKPSTNVAFVPKNPPLMWPLSPKTLYQCAYPKTLYSESLYQSFTLPLLFIFSFIIDVI